MSIPEELLDELLTGHLDGALSGDERARVEQLLRDDPAVKARFDELKQQSLETSRAMYSIAPLPDDFAQRVVEGAILLAEKEQLGSSHPLVKAGQRKVDLAARSRLPVERVIAVVGTLAATVLIASFALRSQPDPGKNGIEGGLAKVDSVSGDPGDVIDPNARQVDANPALDSVVENGQPSTVDQGDTDSRVASTGGNSPDLPETDPSGGNSAAPFDAERSRSECCRRTRVG